MSAKNRILSTILMCILSLVLMALALVIIQYLETPMVHYSHSTGECVRVESKTGEYSCDNLPTNYTHIWVQ